MTDVKNNMFTNRTLDYFLVLVETMNYTRAAEKLGITQPALTQQIKKLERQTGSPVFYSSGKKLHLTQTGKTVLRMTHGIYNIIDRASEEIQKTSHAAQGHIQIGVLPSLDDALLIEFITWYHEQNPGVTLTVHTLNREEMWHQLEHDCIDLAMMYLPDPTIQSWAAYDSYPILTEELLYVDSQRCLDETDAVSLCEVGCAPLALFPENCYVQYALKEAFSKKLLDFPQAAVHLSTADQLLRFSAASGYCTVLPKTFIEKKRPEFKKNAVSFKEPIEFQQAFVYRKDKLLIPRIDVFFHSFKEYLSNQEETCPLVDTYM
ncbi:LysR family transcriptional regulator [Atopococcus tabaci]|uniref:LysR substrate-binding domain-containing protein n=1 Tax=Atopococcus tabaci TaxID=269774 RepID=UPI0024090FFD|nr:LysR family transcriptional regulator [Atopococcus tabaci]